MFETFEKYVLDRIYLTEAELRLMQSLAEIKKVSRRQLLLQEGDVCQHKIFIAKGLLRMFRLKDDGTEYVMRFGLENGWTIDHESYTYHTPSKYYIEALEDTEIIIWTRESMNILFNAIPTFKLLSEQIKEQSINESQQRILINISYTAEEKYTAFINTFPEVFRRVPLHMVASYLGLSRETLSRVRHSQYSRQKNQSIR